MHLAHAALLFLLSACSGAGPEAGLDAAPRPVVPAINVNIPDPTLFVADNTPVSVGGPMTLVWSDEFDAIQLDPESWFFESGDGSQYGIPGWGNNESQWYLPDNAEVSGGLLRITAHRESRGGRHYTSARINTKDRFAFRYGRIEARIRFPAGQGLWSAFWLFPQDEVYGTWAASGEVDVVEMVNAGFSGGSTILGTIHYGGESPANESAGRKHDVGRDIVGEFHDYALEWDVTQMRWFVDGILYAVQDSWWSSGAAYPAPFDKPFYILLNVAVGGNLPGPPDPATVFPATMEVDYVRVYSGVP